MKKLAMLFFLVSFAMVISVTQAAPVEEDGDDLSPYFFVQGDPKVDPFPLLRTGIEVNIAGITAEIELTQVYKNDGKRTIEAIYVFPLGTKSAIHGMTMKIGKRIIKAKIEELLKAQKIYEQAKEDGKIASLLEQKRPNVFQMKVANIMPGDIIEVKVHYTELLVPEDGTYEFVFPTVVGPRFTGESDKKDLKGKDNWTVSPYLHEGKSPSYTFDMKINLNAGMPISKIWVSSHKVTIKKNGKEKAEIILSAEERKGGNRDFILKYSLLGNEIHTGLLLYPGEDENFFLLMLEPPKNVNMKKVPPREYVFIVDVSGSMNGFPLEVSKALMRGIIGDLRKEDYFNILFFAGGSATLSEYPLQATKKNKALAIEMVMSQSGGGGTRILDAFNRALALKKKKGMSRIIVTVTDGYVSVEKKVFDLIRENLNEANFFAFGIGTGVNRYIIDGIARVGRGEPFVVTNQEEAEQIAEKFMNYIKHPLLTDIDVYVKGFDAYEIEPISLPDLFAKRPLILFGKYKNASGRIIVTGKTVSGDYKKTITVKSSLEDKGNIALQYLWAREKIARLSDYGRVGVDVKEEVTNLGLTYNLMTEYTSFVAVDQVTRETGEVVTVKQPLPLPQGVSNYAVGAGASGTKSMRMTFAPSIACEEKVDDISGYAGETPKQVFVSGGKAPAGISLDEIEKAILAQIKNDLEEKFSKWELKSVTIRLEVKNGKIQQVSIKAFDGKMCKKKDLMMIFNKVIFASYIKGSIDLIFEYF